MIDKEPDALNDESDEGPSKSQLKRDAHAIRALGEELAALGAAERARVPLPEDVAEAINVLNKTTKNGAKKRQLGWLAKRLRKVDVGPIEAAMEAIRQAARANTQTLHVVEQWRDRLLGEVEPANPKQALTDFLDTYPHADVQQLRQLQRSAGKEKSLNKPPKSARTLFKVVRDVINQPTKTQH